MGAALNCILKFTYDFSALFRAGIHKNLVKYINKNLVLAFSEITSDKIFGVFIFFSMVSLNVSAKIQR